MRIKTQRRLSEDECEPRRGLNTARHSIVIIEETRLSVGEAIIQVNVHGVKAAHALRFVVTRVHVILEHVAGVVPAKGVAEILFLLEEMFKQDKENCTNLDKRQ